MYTSIKLSLFFINPINKRNCVLLHSINGKHDLSQSHKSASGSKKDINDTIFLLWHRHLVWGQIIYLTWLYLPWQYQILSHAIPQSKNKQKRKSCFFFHVQVQEQQYFFKYLSFPHHTRITRKKLICLVEGNRGLFRARFEQTEKWPLKKLRFLASLAYNRHTQGLSISCNPNIKLLTYIKLEIVHLYSVVFPWWHLQDKVMFHIQIKADHLFIEKVWVLASIVLTPTCGPSHNSLK